MSALLTDELRAMVGRTATYTATEPLSRAAIRYYALATEDDDPRYTDPVAAEAAGYRDVIAPPTLLMDTNQYVTGSWDEDGFLGHSWAITVPNSRAIRGGNAYRFYRPAYPDDVVTVTWTLTDITERTTRTGAALLVVTSDARYCGADGDLIATNTETLIYMALDGPAAVAG